MSNLLNRTEAKLSSTPVLLADGGGVLFANADWIVSADGLEHRNGYFIEREALPQRRPDGVWIWPLHMAGKLWCEPESFHEAFRAAVRAYGLEADAGLALAFAEAAEPEASAERAPVYDLRRPPAAAPNQRQARRSEVRNAAGSSRPAFADAA